MARSTYGDRWFWALGVFGLANLANGAWMLVDPAHWYANLPAAVPDTGPLNLHFVRDVGSAFAVMGGSLLAAAVWPALRVPALDKRECQTIVGNERPRTRTVNKRDQHKKPDL